MEKRITFPITVLTDIQKSYNNRFIDWIESGMHLEHKYEIAKAQYRQKICMKTCNKSQKEKRGCVTGRGLDLFGNPITHCSHLINSANSRLDESFIKHMNFHPAINEKICMFQVKTKKHVKKEIDQVSLTNNFK